MKSFSVLHYQHVQILKSVSVNKSLSRSELSRQQGLSKMTISNYVSDLLRMDYLVEAEMPVMTESKRGRHPTSLTISSKSPLICGVLINRKICKAITANLSGCIENMLTYHFSPGMKEQDLIRIVAHLVNKLISAQTRTILGCGIACVGPINAMTGTILTPPNFYDIRNLNIVEQVYRLTGLHTVLINDATAGALAEKLYGIGRSHANFAYLHIMNGIGMGFVLNNELFNGFSGQSGEIGHVSINYNGMQCSCGNRGCLETYANEVQINQKIQSLAPFYPDSPLTASRNNHLNAVIEAADRGDAIALNVLDEFLTYLSEALVSMINLLDFPMIIIGYQCVYKTDLVERILLSKIKPRLVSSGKSLHIIRSEFGEDAPLIGSSGVIADEFFSQKINLPVM